VLERKVERDLNAAVVARRGYSKKLVPTGDKDWPDRLVLLPGGVWAFVETKAPGKVPRPSQLRLHARLRRAGYIVLVLDHPSKIAALLEAIAILN